MLLCVQIWSLEGLLPAAETHRPFCAHRGEKQCLNLVFSVKNLEMMGQSNVRCCERSLLWVAEVGWIKLLLCANQFPWRGWDWAGGEELGRVMSC